MNFKVKKGLGLLEYYLRRSHYRGQGIHSRFLFDFAVSVIYKKEENDRFNDIHKLRKKLLKSTECIEVEDLGAGSSQGLRKKRRIADIIRVSSTNTKYGKLLYRMVSHLQPEIVIELGTCLGVGTMYMASGSDKSKIYTIEGSSALYAKARDNFEALGFANVISHRGNFDEVLPVIIKNNGRFDFMFIDGNHTKEALLRYFNMSLPFAHENSVIVFDDIRWSEGMLEGWYDICQHADVRFSLDLFNWGIVFLKRNIRKQHFEIFY